MGILSRLVRLLKREKAVDLRSKRLAYLLIMKRGAKPPDEAWYVQQIVDALVPQARASPGAQTKARWQTGPVDVNYAIAAALVDFGPDAGDTRKYLMTTEDFSDALGDTGMVLKMFHRR
jgi:hypothetical protein